MDEKMLRRVLADMLQPIEQRLDRSEERLDRLERSINNIQSQLNALEHRVMDLGNSIRAVPQTFVEMGELRHELSRVEAKTVIQ